MPRNLPEGDDGPPYMPSAWSCFEWGLHSMPRYRDTGGLLHRHSTLTCIGTGPKTGGIISVALSLGLPPPDVIRHPALRSPDFPHGALPHSARPYTQRYYIFRNDSRLFLLVIPGTDFRQRIRGLLNSSVYLHWKYPGSSQGTSAVSWLPYKSDRSPEFRREAAPRTV